MEQETIVSQGRASGEETGDRPSFAGSPVSIQMPAVTSIDRERTGVFTSLVKDDGDIAGLVAYSIYKQNKLDWLQAFELAKGRAPDEPELASYIIGEGTPRRLATYRHLAEATLAGNGPDIEGKTPSRSGFIPKGRTEKAPLSPSFIVACAIIAVLAVITFWLAAHYTVTGR